MRKLIFNLHLWVALILGILVAIFGATGAIMAFEPEIDHLLHWKLAKSRSSRCQRRSTFGATSSRAASTAQPNSRRRAASSLEFLRELP